MSVILHALLLWIGLLGLIVSAAIDVKIRLIPNPVVLAVAVAGFGMRLLDGVSGALESLVIAIAVFLPLGLLAGRGLVGGGDAKMIAAVTLLIEPGHIPMLFLAIALAGGLLAILYLAIEFRAPRLGASLRRNTAGTSDGLVASTARPVSLPYGVAIAAGAVLVLLREGFGCSSGTFC